MKNKRIGKMGELSWFIGVLLCALGVSLCTKANFGLSTIAAPPYILHRFLIDKLPFFTQGFAEYVWQGSLLIVLTLILRRFRVRWLFSFFTAICCGFAIDMWLYLLGGNGAYESMVMRIIAFALGTVFTALAIAFHFRTYIPLQVYELAVVEISDGFGFDTVKVKLVNDIIMLAVSLALSGLLCGFRAGVGAGTVVAAFVNSPLIGLFGRLLDNFFVFDARFPRLFAVLGGKQGEAIAESDAAESTETTTQEASR